jgi:hypothetical protein
MALEQLVLQLEDQVVAVVQELVDFQVILQDNLEILEDTLQQKEIQEELLNHFQETHMLLAEAEEQGLQVAHTIQAEQMVVQEEMVLHLELQVLPQLMQVVVAEEYIKVVLAVTVDQVEEQGLEEVVLQILAEAEVDQT